MTARSRAYAWYVLGLLTTINFVNYVDRMVLMSMYDDLRREFHLSDGQIGALTTSFFTVHAITTFPFGWAADRWNRIKILFAAIAIWSLATLGAAYAVGFVSLLVCRSLVGIGEAAYGPVSNAVLCEVFPPEDKARTVGIFNMGMFGGAAAGMAAGAALGFPHAFQVVAIPGMVLAVLVAFLDVPKVRAGVSVVRPRVVDMARDFVRVLSSRTMLWMLASGILISFTAGGSIAWYTDFVMRYKGMGKVEATIAMGAIAVSGGVLGALTGGLVGDHLMRRWRQGRILAIAIGFFAAIPPSLVAIYVDRGWPFFVASWLQMFFLPWYNGPMGAVIDDVVDDRDASSAQAAFTFILHLFGTGTGAFVVGLASQRWGLRTAMLLPAATTLLAGVFALLAGRYVAGDMDARRARAERLRAGET